MRRLLLVLPILALAACEKAQPEVTTARSGVQIAPAARVPVGSDGLTAEQKNIHDRLALEKPGSIKHLYVISAYSGQTILYSTVRGKVTSSGKRLSPSTQQPYGTWSGGGWYSSEQLGDDGAYGSSVEYLYWWDSKGNYHQHYVSGGQIVHVSDQPMNVGSVTINVEARDK